MKSQKKYNILLAIVLTIAIIAGLTAVVAVASLFIDFVDTDAGQYEDKVIMSLPDYSEGHEWINGFFQDFTCYSEYKYDGDMNAYFTSDRNTYFKPVSPEIKNIICDVLDDYEEWVRLTGEDSKDGDDLTEVYAFKRSCIDESDWYYCNIKDFESISAEESNLYADYDLYYFDSQSGTLYYMHNNI